MPHGAVRRPKKVGYEIVQPAIANPAHHLVQPPAANDGILGRLFARDIRPPRPLRCIAKTVQAPKMHRGRCEDEQRVSVAIQFPADSPQVDRTHLLDRQPLSSRSFAQFEQLSEKARFLHNSRHPQTTTQRASQGKNRAQVKLHQAVQFRCSAFLYWPVLYWAVLYWAVLYWAVLYWPVLYWPVLYWPVLYWAALYWAAQHPLQASAC